MFIAFADQARKRSRRGQGGFTLVELLVVIAILGILAAIVLFNIAGVNANAACNGMKTDGATIQAAADLYYNNNGLYPDSTPADKAVPALNDVVNVQELLNASLLHSAPAPQNGNTETFTYKASPPAGTVTGVLKNSGGTTLCTYNP
jgi:prepilin-type N-terminal cleavage/methylation domain-containing protein